MGNDLLLLDENLLPVETPLLPPTHTFLESNQNTIIFPYNITAVKTTSANALPTLNNFLIDSTDGDDDKGKFAIFI